MNDDWLDQLNQIREDDKAKREQAKAKTAPLPPPQNLASDLLRQSKAHELLRQIQKVLLGGQGSLDLFDRTKEYDRLMTLVWQGPISAARRPDPDDPEPYNYILVGVRKGQIWVNNKRVTEVTPENMKQALLAACKNPRREKPGTLKEIIDK
jgi:hypothetical protein